MELKNELEGKLEVVDNLYYVFVNFFLDEWLLNSNQDNGLLKSGKKWFQYFSYGLFCHHRYKDTFMNIHNQLFDYVDLVTLITSVVCYLGEP